MANLNDGLVFIWTCIVFINLIEANIENTDLNYAPPKQTYDELYNDAIESYSKDDHINAVVQFEKAISDYRHELEVNALCWLKCQEKFKRNFLSFNKELFDSQLEYLHYFVKMKACVEQCKLKFLGARGPVARSVVQLFEQREPYNYIQFSYFKVGEITKSLDAAYTYYEANPDHIEMKNNVKRLLQLTGKDISSVHSMEEYPHIALYKKGEDAYHASKNKDCIRYFEESLKLFYKEMEKCQAICEYQHEKYQGSYSATIFKHFKAILDCRKNCRTKLAEVNRNSSIVYFVPYYFHFLQMCYFHDGRVVEAAISAQTYSLMVPDDPVMKSNIAFYRKQPEIRGKKFKPRDRASKFYKELSLEKSLYNIVKGYAEPLFPNEEVENLKEEDIDSIYMSVAEELSATRQVKGDIDESSNTFSIPLHYRNQQRWKNHPDIKNSDVSLLYDESSLNGTDRVAFDGLAKENECQSLMKLLKKLSIGGDGYKHNHADADHPFTKKELFKGVHVGAAVDALAVGNASLHEVELYFNLSERARLVTQEYFDLPVKLHFAFTHLVCRHALEDTIKLGEDHISHPVHSDNCVLGADGDGTCPKRPPAYTWRDYSGILYLNDEFEGGDFIFADYKMKIEAKVPPKCGRFVAFRSNGIENLHGVLGVKKGTRCALPIWFTLSPHISEDSRPAAESKLRVLKRRILDGTLKRRIKSEL